MAINIFPTAWGTISVNLTEHYLFISEPVQSCPSTTVVQVPCADTWKEWWVTIPKCLSLSRRTVVWIHLQRGFSLSSQAGTHPLKRMDKELRPLCTGNMSLGQSILFSSEYVPPLSDSTGDISSFSRTPSRWLIWHVFLRLAPVKTLFWYHLTSPLSVWVRRMWGYH